MNRFRRMARQLIADWQREGDIAPLSELRRDAFLHIRWLIEKGKLK